VLGKITAKHILIASAVCLILSLVALSLTFWNLAQYRKSQLEFETSVASTLRSYLLVLEHLENRQNSVESILTDSNELRLTLNEIKGYNEKQQKGWPKDRSKRQSIGGE
jgi:hypothetical protein